MDSFQADINKIKKSYFNLLEVFMTEPKIESKFLSCIVKWGIHLGVNTSDLKELEKAHAIIPSTKADRIEAIYHLVYMIYLDKVVEDLELEVASVYAQRLGFEKGLVGDLFKSIATIDYDRISSADIQKEVEDFIKIQYSLD